MNDNQLPEKGRSYGEIPAYPGYGYPGTSTTSPWPRYLTFLKRLWGIPVLTLAIALAGASVYTVLQPPAFVSAARLYVSGKLQLKDGNYYSEELQFFFGTQVEMLQSEKIQQAAVIRVQTTDPTLTSCPVKLKVVQAPKSSMFILQATGENPKYVQSYLDALIEEYLNYRKQVRSGSSDETVTSLSAQVFQYDKDLKAEQAKLDAYQASNNVAAIVDEASATSAYLSRLNQQLSDMQLEDQLAAALSVDPSVTNNLASTNVIGSTVDPRQITAAGATPLGPSADVSAARQQFQMLRLQRDELAPFLRPKHPKMQGLADQIARAEKLMGMFLQQSRDDLEPAHQARQIRMQAVQAAIKEWEGKVLETNKRLIEFQNLQTNIVRTQALYDRVFNLLQSVDVTKNLDQEVVSVMERASLALPAKPSLPKALVLACVAGIGGGLMLVFLVARFDDRITSMNELTEQFEEEIVGQVPNVVKGQRKGKLQLVEPDDDRHMFAESYRNIRSSILFMPVEEARPKLLLVTSAIPNEGKSTVSANLARTMAFSGGRVLLIDGDLRKGRQHEYFGLERGRGLAELLRGSGKLDDYVLPTSLPNLFLLPAGDPVTDASERFLSAQFEQLLSDARANFDQVILDSAPVFAADDAPTMAPKMDGVLFVIRGGFTRARMARQALEILYQRQAKVLGLIFNRADVKARSYYYYKYSDYYNVVKNGNGENRGKRQAVGGKR